MFVVSLFQARGAAMVKARLTNEEIVQVTVTDSKSVDLRLALLLATEVG